ncbi:hypothetical protein [Georgenia soli]|uniref:hypothetical protein n=1 Tax=Georgenia soli TaxID=638953 RepID=UPI000BF3AB40|nr:hypothetical protein [Georgenia soli]
MLLIIAKETNPKSPEMRMRLSDARDWYGISPKTAQNGLNNLRDLGLVHERKQRVKAPLSPTGSTTHFWYSLTGSYGTEARSALQSRANKARKRRDAAATHGPKSKQLAKPMKGNRGGKKKRANAGARAEGR